MVRVAMVKSQQVVSKAKSIRKAKKNRPQKLRKSLTPGTVLILLTGQFRGKRVVMLKQMEKSGLLLVTGPYAVNGVPLRRVNARQCIATSTKVSIAGVDAKKITDEYFAKKDAKSFGEVAFLAKKTKADVDANKKATQKAVDAALVKEIGKNQAFKRYLKSKFALSNGDKPHAMKF
jgi:large subunit ribosomal protein L6e